MVVRSRAAEVEQVDDVGGTRRARAATCGTPASPAPSPCSSPCSTTSSAARAQQRGGRVGEPAHDVEAVGAAEQRARRVVLAPPRGRAARRRPGCTAGCSPRRRRGRPARPAALEVRGRGVAAVQHDLRARPPRRRRTRATLRRAQPYAALLELDRVHDRVAAPRWRARARWRPTPVHRSTARRSSGSRGQRADGAARRRPRSPAAGRTRRGRPRASRWRNGASPSEVLQRHAGGAPHEQRLEAHAVGAVDGVGQEHPAARHAQHVREQQLGVDARASARPRAASRRSASTSTSRSVRTGGVQPRHVRPPSPSEAMRAARSASTQACTSASISPSSTSSRL